MERLFTLSLYPFRYFRMNKMAEVASECAEKEYNWKCELYTAQKIPNMFLTPYPIDADTR
jgi:hypothetical protein